MQRLPFSSYISEMKAELPEKAREIRMNLAEQSMVKWEEIELIVNRTKEQPVLGEKKNRDECL